MDIILFVLMFLVLLAEIFFFQGKVFALIVAVIVCAGYLIFRIFIKKRVPKILGRVVCYGLLAILAVCIFQMGIKGNGGGFIIYANDMEEVCTYLHKGDYDKAAELIEEMQEEYGQTDTIHMLEALNMLAVGESEEAYKKYLNIKDKNSMVSIVIAEQIYMEDTTGEYTDNLFDLYCTAADLYPEWEYIQLCAGVIKIDFKQYESAQYYLYNAYAVEPENPQTLYFLGVSNYKLGDREKALYFFNESVECGADDTIKALIKNYLDEMDYWNKESAK